MDNAPVCKAAGLIIEGRYDHIFWTPCIVHNLNLILEEIDNKVSPLCILQILKIKEDFFHFFFTNEKYKRYGSYLHLLFSGDENS